MQLPHSTIYDESIWPYMAYQHPNTREFLFLVKGGNYRGVKRLIMHYRFLVFQFDDCKQTGLHWAVKRNDISMVKILCKRFSRVDGKDIVGRTALHYAVKQNSLKMVKLLLSHHANPGVKSECLESPLDLCKNLDILVFLERARLLFIMKTFVTDKRLRAKIWRDEGLYYFRDDEEEL
jgi:hypothetical protein